jgi:hypothetical protein
MDEETIRKIVRDELWNEVNREGGVCDHTREAALNMVQPIIDVKFRNLQDFMIGQVSQ